MSHCPLFTSAIMSWGPFAEGKNDYFNTPALKEIGEKHAKTPAQVALRFLLQSGVVLIPKSVHKNRILRRIHIHLRANRYGNMPCIYNHRIRRKRSVIYIRSFSLSEAGSISCLPRSIIFCGIIYSTQLYR